MQPTHESLQYNSREEYRLQCYSYFQTKNFVGIHKQKEAKFNVKK